MNKKRYIVRQTFESLGDPQESIHSTKVGAENAAARLEASIAGIVQHWRTPAAKPRVGSTQECEAFDKVLSAIGWQWDSEMDRPALCSPSYYGIAGAMLLANEAVEIEEEDVEEEPLIGTPSSPIRPTPTGRFPYLCDGLYQVALGNMTQWEIAVLRLTGDFESHGNVVISVLGKGAWEFSIKAHPSYVQEKLGGKAIEGDADNLADFINCQLGCHDDADPFGRYMERLCVDAEGTC